MSAYIAVISAGRPQNVERMLDLIGMGSPHWYVGAGDTAAYTAAGATVAAEAPLCQARNLALGGAFINALPCVQVSDDLRKLEWTADGEAKQEMTFPLAVALLLQAMDDTGARLAGVAPTNNAFFYPKGTPVSTDKFIVGDLFAVRPCDLRFSEDMLLKEDYDYTAQHLDAYGRVARVNGILATFQHRTNKGGAVDVRTAEREQDAIAQLKARWPGWFKDNPKRPNEVLMRYSTQGSFV